MKIYTTNVYTTNVRVHELEIYAYRIRYDTIRYDSVYITCSKKLTGSQLSPPHGTNKKIKM